MLSVVPLISPLQDFALVLVGQGAHGARKEAGEGEARKREEEG